jgi:hypothetical protein
MSDCQLRLGRQIGAAFIFAALVLFVVSAYGLASHANAQTSSRLEGQVFNGTAAALPERTANLDVTLFQMGASGPVTQTVQTDAQGRFAFSGLKLEANSPYFARVDYEGIHYFSDILTPGIEASNPLSLTVYETQTVPADFQIDRTHFILDVDKNALTGFELLQVKNPTDRAFVLPLPLPRNVSDLQFNDPRDQSRAIQGEDGSLAFPILPTTEQIFIGVRLTTSPPDYTLQVNVPVKVGRMNVLVSQTGGVQVASPQLTPGPVFTPQSGSNYWQLNRDNVPASSTVLVVISNLPGGDNSALVRNAVLGLGGLAALLMLALPFIRQRCARPAVVLSPLVGGTPPHPPLRRGEEAGDMASERLARLEAIADLDDAFEAGEIPEDEYHFKRAELKAELMNDPNPQA